MYANDNTVHNMDRKSLLHVIHHVIGYDKYSDNLNSLVKSDVFARAQENHLVWHGHHVATNNPFPQFGIYARDSLSLE